MVEYSTFEMDIVQSTVYTKYILLLTYTVLDYNVKWYLSYV